jgi:hypothetical protein
MKNLLFAVILFIYIPSFSQQLTYDIITFTQPKGWKKENLENVLSLSTTNNKTKTWAQIGIIKSTASKGSIDTDFESEWKELIVKPYQQYNVSEQPLGVDTQSLNGWKVCTGLGQFIFNKDTASVLLTTFSNGTRCASVRMMSNSTNYGTALDDFLASVNLPDANSLQVKNDVAPTINTSTPIATGFTFNTTNFDDGWTAVVKEDWVELTKGNLKALIHYPRAEDKNYYSQYDERVSVFWNLLVAPRYTNLRQYQSPGYNNSFEPGYFAAGLLNDKATGKDVWVALFSKGKSEWVEVIAPDKETFVQAFGVDNPDTYFDGWDLLLNLTRKNYFAVGENDLVGKWSSNFSSSTAYYNVYTGAYAGAAVFGSASSFTFGPNKTYRWQIAMGQSQPGGTMKVDQAKSNGTWKLLSNWQVWFSDMEGKPKTHNAYFSCFKGGRILWLQDISYGGYTAYGKVSE